MNSSTSPCSGRSTTPDMWEGVIEYVENARTIAISGHTNPDGDALGSLLGLGASIRAQFPDKKVDLLLAACLPLPCGGRRARARRASR